VRRYDGNSGHGCSLRRRAIAFVEFDETGDVLHKVGGQLFFAEHAGSDRRRNRRFEVCRRVSLPYFPRGALMESMHKIVQLKRIDFGTIPTRELRAQLAESLAQVAIVSDRCPFANEAIDPFRNFLRGLFWL
jgi:hypothetical protein